MAKKRKTEERAEDSGDKTVAIFLSLMIILLSFFILLNNLAEEETEREQAAIQSVFQAFSISPVKLQTAPPLGGMEDRTALGEYQSMKQAQDRLNEMLGRRGLLGEVEVEVVGADFRITLSGDIMFAMGEFALSSRANRPLDDLAERLATVDNPIRIEGHTASADTELSRSAIPTFRELSIRRSLTVSRALADRGIATERITAGGYGDSRPLRPNDTEAGRARNRRVEIVVIDGARTGIWKQLEDEKYPFFRLLQFWENDATPLAG